MNLYNNIFNVLWEHLAKIEMKFNGYRIFENTFKIM